MNKDLSVYPEQAIQKILELNRKAIDYGNRIIKFGSEDDIDRAIAKQELDNAILNFIVLLEQYPDGHGTLLEEARRLLVSSRENPLEPEVFMGEAYLMWPYRLRNLVNMFSSIHLREKKTESDKDIDLLLEIISRSEYYITRTDIFKSAPNSENDVHVRIEGLLGCVYDDLETRPRIPKKIKSFEADNAIPSLKTCIEYKYITSRNQGKKILDQVFADILGYQSRDYDNYVFVLYETERVFPKADWDKMIESCKPRNRIECVVIRGSCFSEESNRQLAQVSQTGVHIGDQIHRSLPDSRITLRHDTRGPQHPDHAAIHDFCVAHALIKLRLRFVTS